MSFRKVLQRDGYERHVEFDGRNIKGHSVQRNRGAILKQNAELRKSQDAVRRTDGLRLALDIPIADLQIIDRWFPGIANPGHPDYKFQMRKFMKSPASAPYRVTDGARANAGHIVVK